MIDAKESADDGKRSRVSNEQLFEKLEDLVTAINIIQIDIEDLKKRTGFRDTPIGAPSKTNYNTDPGPWGKSCSPAQNK